MKAKSILVLICSVILLGGCASLDRLLTINSLSENQDAQAKYVKEQNKTFEKLLKAVNENRIGEYPDQKSFIKSFGEPLFTKEVFEGNATLTQWLYRYEEKLAGSEKVYLYFDKAGKLVRFEHVVPKKGTEVLAQENEEKGDNPL